jgi:thiol-disulfide isomerase/thioredoxin
MATVLLLVLCVLVVAIAVVLMFKERTTHEVLRQPEIQPVLAPAFSFPDASGALVSLEALDAPVRVVTFWASWSPYSRQELQDLVRLQEAYGDRIAIAALNRDVDPSEGRAFLEKLALGDTLVFAYDTADTYYKEVGGYNMPETLFVGPDNEVLYHQHGPMQYDAMVEVLERLLDES